VTPSHIGKYEIQRRLGAGGMGSLYLARDPGLDRLVALKLLKDEHQDEPELRERFKREARSVARLSHRNIIVVYEIGEDQGRPFMAMEYIAGETLNQVLRRTPTPPITKRLSLIEDLCDGLGHAHAQGIIHRDIKPANIMLDGEGVLKILDFGIARIGKAGITQDGVMMGTVNYMSPEQAMGSGVDHRSDIFAVGAVLYEAIALEQAFPGWIDSGVLHRILYAGPVPLTERVPGIDPELAGIVQRALDRDPNQRYQDLLSMRRDITRVRRRLQDAGQDPGATSAGRRSSDDRGSDRRVLDPERIAKLRRQEVEDNLRFGQEAFARGDHDAALQHAERAAMADPDSPRVFDLLDKARFAIEAKAIRQLLAEAQRLLAEGHLEDAAALVEEASAATLPESQGAPELRAEVRTTAEKIAATRERERRIDSNLERARTSIEQGGFETALRAVYEVLAIDPDRAEARELEQLAKSRLQAQREHERARRNAYDQLRSARTLAGDGKFDEAAEAIHSVRPPSDTVRMAVADALGEVRKLQRQAAHAAIVAQARTAFDEGQLEQALLVLESIPAEDQTPTARSLRGAVEDAVRQKRELERKRQALEGAVAAIESLIASEDLTRALERLEEAARIGLDDERIPALRHRISDLGAAAQERQRREARDRLATKRVEAARQLLANGDGYAAIALLDRDTSGHPLVATALAELRVAVAEQEERGRQEAERKRKEQEAKQRAELEAKKRLEEQRKAAERQRQDEERRQQQAEQHRRQQEVATLLIGVERALAENRPAEATVLLKRADEVGAVEDTELLHRVAAAKAAAEGRERISRQLEGHLSRARELLAGGDLQGAKQAADAALALEVDHRDARQLLTEIAEAEDRRAEEARRVEEARRREEELQRQAAEERRHQEEARKREESLNDLFARARKAKNHQAALKILNEASTLAPGDPRVHAQIAERTASLEREHLEEQRRKEEARRLEEQQRQDARRREEEARRLEEVRQKEAARRQEEARRREQEEARRREEEARKREAAVSELIGRASKTQEHEAALTLLTQAETLAPTDPRIRTLISARNAALEGQRAAVRAAEEAALRERERREQENRDAIASKAVLNATQLFAAGRHGEALALLRESPAHAAIDPAIADLERQRAELERRRLEEARRQRREERRAATRAAIDRAIHDRRLQTVAGLILVAALAWGTWQLWPASTEEMSTPVSSVSPPTTPPIDTQPPTNSASPNANPGPVRANPPVSTPPDVSPIAPSGTEKPPRAGQAGSPPPTRPISPNASPSATNAPGQQAPASPASPRPAPAPSEDESPVVPQTPPRRSAPEETGRPAPTPPAAIPQSPPPAPTPAPTPDLASDRRAIDQLLNEFVETYSTMDDSRLRRIDPTFPGIRSRELIRSVRLSLPDRMIVVAPDGQTATLSASGTFTYVWNRSGFPPTTRAQLNWRLQKVGGNWTVVR